jgi:hypothetical protein
MSAACPEMEEIKDLLVSKNWELDGDIPQSNGVLYANFYKGSNHLHIELDTFCVEDRDVEQS